MKAADRPTLLFLVTEDWSFASHRLELARTAVTEGYRVIVATRERAHGQVLREAGCEVAPLEWSRGTGNAIGEMRFWLRLLRLYRKERPVAVHHVALKPVVYGSLAAMIARVPVVVNAIAGLGYVFTNRNGSARILRPLLGIALRFVLNRRGSWAILQNPDDQALLSREAGLDPARVVMIRGAGVDLEEFEVTPEPDGRPVVALPARMLWDKGVGEFVDAARKLRAEGCRARFVLVGGLDSGNPRVIEQAVLDEWVTEGVVEWWGHCTPMSAVYRSVHVVALPSYREGLPKALLEAAASGRPIVTTDVPGCREVVVHGENGLVVPARAVGPLVEALRCLIDDPELRASMGRLGRERAEQYFSVGEVVSRTLPLYLRGPE